MLYIQASQSLSLPLSKKLKAQKSIRIRVKSLEKTYKIITKN